MTSRLLMDCTSDILPVTKIDLHDSCVDKPVFWLRLYLLLVVFLVAMVLISRVGRQ